MGDDGNADSWRQGIIIRGGDMECTRDYPVMVVVVVVAIAVTPTKERFAVKPVACIFCFACMMADRNNEIRHLIAKYFLRFLHELTVISGAQTSAFFRE